MQHLLVLALICLMPFQKKDPKPLVAYRTLADYEAGKGERLGDFEGYEWSKAGLRLLTTEPKGKPKMHKLTDYWGYAIANNGYRIHEGMPHLVVQGKDGSVYYENGLAHMNMQMNKKEAEEVEYGYYCFLSKSLTSPVYHIPSKEASKAFKDDAGMQPFLTCIEKMKWTHAEKIRECAKKEL